MGFRVRKRTRGKNAWLNLSLSKKGFNSSMSVKLGDTTINFGKDRVRTTYNLGNGMSYVNTTSTKTKKKAPTSVSSRRKVYVSKMTEAEEAEMREKYPDRRDLGDSFGVYWLKVLFKTIAFFAFLYVLIVSYYEYSN